MSNISNFYHQQPSTYSKRKIQINKNFKPIIYSLLINPNKLQYTIFIKDNILFFNPLDSDFIHNTLTKNHINFKVL